MVHYYLSLATANINPMSYPNSNANPNSDSPVSSGFNTQSQMGLPEVLQMCCLSRRSGQITFRSGESYGYVFIQHGRVLHALCGPLEGEEAVYTMLTWPGGGFTLNEDILPHKKTITLTWEQLLFEGARRADEGIVSPKIPLSGAPITTAEPTTNHRAQENQPKLIITRPDLPPAPYELTNEFTHVGRAAGNEIPLPYPSVSNRHCIFILSGTDIVLRDLNSSNGTLVNGEAINEVMLRPGDEIQIGVVQMKFEAGIKRPKLSPVAVATSSADPLKKMSSPIKPLTRETVKLPARLMKNPEGASATDDSAYVKGQSAISYENLAKPEEPKGSSSIMPTLLMVIGLTIAAVVVYFIFFSH